MEQTREEELRKECFISIEDCINSRRCFMTGEYCSKQTNIQKERKKLHENRSINAFVIMNFSNMSDVVYKWRLKSFIESLSKYLYIDLNEELHCVASSKPSEGQQKKVDDKTWKKVEKIYVVRADSDPASNYVICSRVCQQMQIADLVIIDVSVENTNVFYEFGMAVALGKLILPICYSESFYALVLPETAAKNKVNRGTVEHHIDCYPWRKKLFEYYGIRYKSSKKRSSRTEEVYNKSMINEESEDEIDGTYYFPYEKAVNEDYGFTDLQYSRFPYHEIVEANADVRTARRIGEEIYNRLAKTYNTSTYDHNTLVVYTMDGFLNEAQAGQCIINFYNNMTKQMKEEHCFWGERVGVLVEANSIPEDIKDAKTDRKLLYSVGEIIHIGTNQATYIALKAKIKTKDFLSVNGSLRESEVGQEGCEWEKDIQRFVKEHIRNKGFLVYPNNPVYVNRVKNGLQNDILKKEPECRNRDFCYDHFFCLYHVMLRNLKYTNEIVVDISKNSLQSLFWLGAAHGSDIYAVTVQHEETNKEREIMTGSPEKKERNIFDVAGLWTAILRSNDTEGFYRQLALAQIGIERHSKLMLKNVESYEERLCDSLYSSFEFAERRSDSGNGEEGVKLSCQEEKIREILEEKEKEEARVLESYYRDQFWKPMLRYNRLWIYLPQVDDRDPKKGEPKLHTVKWDVDAIAALSHYLSKRKIIGEYYFRTIGKNESDNKAGEVNFICVGDAARPLLKKSGQGTESLAEYINSELGNENYDIKMGYNIVHKRWEQADICKKQPSQGEKAYSGFSGLGRAGENIIFAQFPQSSCNDCMKKIGTGKTDAREWVHFDISNINTDPDHCEIMKSGSSCHIQIAQLILWREMPEDAKGRVHFRVSLTGVSGPATYGLSTIFVDDVQRKELFNMEEDVNLLSKLQETIRQRFMNIFCRELQKALERIDTYFWGNNQENGMSNQDRMEIEKKAKQQYYMRVKHAAAAYLSTVLYRYFLPFLSLEDEYRICNGMRTYVTSMMAAKISPFSLSYPQDGDPNFTNAASSGFIICAAKAVTEALEEVVHSFRGVEAFYGVEVKVEISHMEKAEIKSGINKDSQVRDSRKVLGIKELENGGSPCVNCLFKFAEDMERETD